MSIADVSASSVDCKQSRPHVSDVPATNKETSHAATVKKVDMTAHTIYCYTHCCYELCMYTNCMLNVKIEEVVVLIIGYH